MVIHSDESNKSLITPRVATFFAVYPDPLGLTARGCYFVIADKAPVHGFSDKVALHIKGDETLWLQPTLAGHLVTSIRFHRGRHKLDPVETYDTELMEIIQAVSSDSFPEFEQSSSMKNDHGHEDQRTAHELFMAYTIVEMTTQLVVPQDGGFSACEFNHDAMGPALTRCIDGLIRVVNAYRFTEHISIQAPARERIGPTIVGATRPADPALGGWDAPAHSIINTFATSGWPMLRGKEEYPSTSEKMLAWLQLDSIDYPVVAIAHLQAELDTAFGHQGNFRAAVMFAHSASEVLLDTALMAMLFEEGQTPAEAASMYDAPLKTRLLTKYHDRLGGVWSATGDNAVSTWINNLLKLRHRVAHTGYMPSWTEANTAREAHYSLGTHLRDRLAARVKTYPLAAGMLLTAKGFERRGLHTKATTEALGLANSNRMDDFISWRRDVLSN